MNMIFLELLMHFRKILSGHLLIICYSIYSKCTKTKKISLLALSSVYDIIRMVFDFFFKFLISISTTVSHSSFLEQFSHHSQECGVTSKFQWQTLVAANSPSFIFPLCTVSCCQLFLCYKTPLVSCLYYFCCCCGIFLMSAYR